ncbi:sterol-sensing domain of SREBP cleavage-activation-domain-containing protein [Podospora appendiculata]|uniref:Sterol regulatory element-binding protein cleavage-activating protein n=1 Tax=Podospora appendiculata TaxID=314037 RepID=A0AAE0X5Z8_9PEZI|nr:sterol-sensing domain of SREBP cleavage-activation-domain-containing protein [Podospora appendiculata]
MLWYLLYPVRGTTEAPVLAPDHALRTAFSRYGKWTARNVKTVLPLSVAGVFVLLYPFAFLYTTDATNITSGVSNLPHHVWTDARPLNERSTAVPDVIMRSIWVHGSYMKALELDVLLGALELQDELLGPTTDFNPRQPSAALAFPDPLTDLSREERDAFHIINGLTNQSWFFHSPLQYWDGSRENIMADQDIIATVNAKKSQPTSVNVTLRHSIVFSGKRFEERKLAAADALVITLIHLRDSPVGRQWERKAAQMATRLSHKWTIIPANGRSTSSQLYEFQFRPMSWLDWAILSIAYTLTFLYLRFSLSKARALKSRLGLMVTILAQIAAAIGASFTICAIFKVDLSRVPYYAYPLVVLAISMENSLRLINAVIMTSSTISIGDRIGEAFGATAHVAVANRVQNLLILLVLSRITFPGVAAFCTFAAIAIIFDFIFLATFFLAVLSVDVRQRELSELEKASLKRTKYSNMAPPRPWLAFLRQLRPGEAAVSTRVAGTIVVLGFVLIAQSHYSPESRHQWLNWIVALTSRGISPSTAKSSLLVDIHQARSPTSWLRLQDHETAREVINVVKPWAYSYVACVYDPLVFVLKGSDRIPHSKEPFFLPAVYDFIHHELPRFAVFILTVVSMLLLFTSYLLRGELKHPGERDHPDDEPLLSVQSLSNGHKLDVMKMVVSPSGQLVSAGLDRQLQMWDMPAGGLRSHIFSDSDRLSSEDPFPVWAMAIDRDSKWLAIVSRAKAMLWYMEEQLWVTSMEIELGGQPPETVFFNNGSSAPIPPLVVVRRNGTMVEIQFDMEESREFAICKTPLAWAASFAEDSSTNQATSQLSILTASRKSCIHLVRQHGSDWVSTEVDLPERESRDVHSLIPIAGFSMYLIGRLSTVDLVDLESSTVIHTFQTEPMELRSLKQISSTRSGQAVLTSLTLSYANSQTGDLVVQTYLPENEGGAIYSYCPSEPGHRPWGSTREITRHIANPGVSEPLSNGSIVGVRKRPAAPVKSRSSLGTTNGLRRRGGGLRESYTATTNTDTVWEAWVINHLETKGDLETMPLDLPTPNEPGHLMISEPGPMVRLGTTSVAVGFGDVIKVVSVGHEYFDRGRDSLTTSGRPPLRRKRMPGTLVRNRTQ